MPDDLIILEPGEWVGDYEILEFLGNGGHGQVYVVRHRDNPDTVRVLKVTPATTTESNRQFTELCEREARYSLMMSGDDGFPTVFEAGPRKIGRVLVMDLIKAPTLKGYAESELHSVRQAIEIAARLAASVHRMHEKKIIHCDIKPDNLMFDGVTLTVLDFGISSSRLFRKSVFPDDTNVAEFRLPVDISEQSEATVGVGTHSFSAPEQLWGPGADFASDQYSVAAVLWFLLSGHPLLGDTTHIQTRHEWELQHQEALTSVRSCSSLPSRLIDILCRSLSRNPGDRFNSCHDLANALRETLTPQGVAVLGQSLGFLYAICTGAMAFAVALLVLATTAASGHIITFSTAWAFLFNELPATGVSNWNLCLLIATSCVLGSSLGTAYRKVDFGEFAKLDNRPASEATRLARDPRRSFLWAWIAAEMSGLIITAACGAYLAVVIATHHNLPVPAFYTVLGVPLAVATVPTFKVPLIVRSAELFMLNIVFLLGLILPDAVGWIMSLSCLCVMIVAVSSSEGVNRAEVTEYDLDMRSRTSRLYKWRPLVWRAIVLFVLFGIGFVAPTRHPDFLGQASMSGPMTPLDNTCSADIRSVNQECVVAATGSGNRGVKNVRVDLRGAASWKSRGQSQFEYSGAALSPDGNRIALWDPRPERSIHINIASSADLSNLWQFQLDSQDQIVGVAFHPDERHLLVLTRATQLLVLDVRDRGLVDKFVFPQLGGLASSLAISPDGKRIACAFSVLPNQQKNWLVDAKVIVFKFPIEGEKLPLFLNRKVSRYEVLNDLGDKVSNMCWLPNSQQLLVLTGSRDENIDGPNLGVSLWNADSKTQVASIRKYRSIPKCAAVSADGETALIGDEDGELLIWELESGSQRPLGKCHRGRVIDVEWHPGANRFVSVGEDGFIRQWSGWTE